MDPFKTHGAFSWMELMTADCKAAADFYSTLLGWKFETTDMGPGQYHVIKVADVNAQLHRRCTDDGCVLPLGKLFLSQGTIFTAHGAVVNEDLDACAR